jgi:O-antigen/teichoic acid export membrane protein
MTVRLATLAARFLLSIYLAKFLSLSAVGEFGLVQGVAGVVPPLTGLGLNYFVNREIVGKPPLQVGKMLRDRLAVNIALCLLLIVGAWRFEGRGLLHGSAFWVVAGVLLLETISFELCLALISLRRPITSNVLLFVRSALWVAPVILFGFFWRSARTLDWVYAFWFLGQCAAFVLTLVVLRDWPIGTIAKSPVDFQWMSRTARKAGLIYVNDLGIAGQVYADRYVIDHYLGAAPVGAYTLCFTLANAVLVLASSGVIQPSLPELVASPAEKWLGRFGKMVFSTCGAGIVLGIGVSMTAMLLLPVLGFGVFREHAPLLLGMMAGILLKLVSDAVNYGLYSRGHDRALATINILGLFTAVAATALCIRFFGLVGVCVSMVVTPLVTLSARLWALRRDLGLGAFGAQIAGAGVE